ncbi:hypothetical protein [Streptomyces sp. NBC_01538]|uniref:hypothetical protein n=1 Tax=Streptomyces sp. NBC_01538 TaxID=2903897 RepID=UPI003865BC94
MTQWETFPFEVLDGARRVTPLLPPVLPKPERDREPGPEDCVVCRKPVAAALWADERRRLDAAITT